jgi:hypothetical protein
MFSHLESFVYGVLIGIGAVAIALMWTVLP